MAPRWLPELQDASWEPPGELPESFLRPSWRASWRVFQESIPGELPRRAFQESFPGELSRRAFQDSFTGEFLRELSSRAFQESFQRELSRRAFQESLPGEVSMGASQERFSERSFKYLQKYICLGSRAGVIIGPSIWSSKECRACLVSEKIKTRFAPRNLSEEPCSGAQLHSGPYSWLF